jgi:hypothetical protein
LRDNPGGAGEAAIRFAGNFFAKKIELARIVTRTGTRFRHNFVRLRARNLSKSAE